MINYEIKIAESDNDINGIAECAMITWHDTYDELLPGGQVDYMLEKYQSYDAIKNDIKNNGYIYYIAVFRGKVVGFCGIHPEADRKKLFISKIYVLPKYHRNGIATRLFNIVLELYKNDYKTFYLTVNKYNKRAIKTYEHFGFTIADSTVSDIGSGYFMDDYIMECKTY